MHCQMIGLDESPCHAPIATTLNVPMFMAPVDGWASVGDCWMGSVLSVVKRLAKEWY